MLSNRFLPGSLLHGLGVWVDCKLQEVAQKIYPILKTPWS